VARVCEDYGVRVQYSVFECRLEESEFAEFWRKLTAEIDPASSPQQPTPILPDPKLTPGDTFDVTVTDVCVPGYAKKVRAVPAWLKRQAYAEYGITEYKTRDYEVDHLIPPSTSKTGARSAYFAKLCLRKGVQQYLPVNQQAPLAERYRRIGERAR
jgi:hypothetical protein